MCVFISFLFFFSLSRSQLLLLLLFCTGNFFYYIKLRHSCAVCSLFWCYFSVGAIENGWNPCLYYDWCMTFTICSKCLHTLNPPAHNFLLWHISLSIMVIIIVNVVAFLFFSLSLYLFSVLLSSLMARVSPAKYNNQKTAGRITSNTHRHMNNRQCNKKKTTRENKKKWYNWKLSSSYIFILFKLHLFFQQFSAAECVCLCVCGWIYVCFPFCHLFFFLACSATRDLLDSRY